MTTNLDKFKADLARLIKEGQQLLLAMHVGYTSEAEVKKLAQIPEHAKVIEGLPSFLSSYQTWYSEAVTLIRQVLPDRLTDFVRHYEKPKGRKAITFENYRIDDYLQGLKITRYREVVVDSSAAVPHFEQQIAIVRAAERRFESSLFDIKQIVQADLFDSELDAAEELKNSGFLRAAGALAGVVLERHLKQVCANRTIAITKKNITISDCNDALKASGAIDVSQWRFIQHLGDIRNMCDHSKSTDPNKEQITDLLSGVARITKTVL